MKARECPFCGEKPEKYRSTWYVCKKCEIDVPVEVWDYRHDDWRSDGWPERFVLVLADRMVGLGRKDAIGDNVSVTFSFQGSGFSLPVSECKWKPLPASEGGIDET